MAIPRRYIVEEAIRPIRNIWLYPASRLSKRGKTMISSQRKDFSAHFANPENKNYFSQSSFSWICVNNKVWAPALSVIIQIIYNKLLTAPSSHTLYPESKENINFSLSSVSPKILTEVCTERALNTCHLVSRTWFIQKIFSNIRLYFWAQIITRVSWTNILKTQDSIKITLGAC